MKITALLKGLCFVRIYCQVESIMGGMCVCVCVKDVPVKDECEQESFLEFENSVITNLGSQRTEDEKKILIFHDLCICFFFKAHQETK
jgi:hypothetical protein